MLLGSSWAVACLPYSRKHRTKPKDMTEKKMTINEAWVDSFEGAEGCKL